MAWKSLARTVRLDDEIDLVAAVDVVGSKMFGDQWTKNLARSYLPIVRYKNKESGRHVIQRYGYDDETGKKLTERVIIPKAHKSDMTNLALMQLQARKVIIGLVRDQKLSGSIAFSEKNEPLDEETSFLKRAYRRVFCSSMVRRQSRGEYEFGYITIKKSDLLEALSKTETKRPGLREGSEWNKALLRDFQAGITAWIEERYGQVTDNLPLFTNFQVNSIVRAVLFDGLLPDGKRDQKIRAESDDYRRPSKMKFKEYASSVLPAKCLKQKGAGRRNSKRRDAATAVLKHLGIEA